MVAIYLRKSREEEHETRETTLARHERMLLDFCRRNNLTVKTIYKEVVSGESLENRPQARIMLEAVTNGEYDGVVVVDLERLSRGNQIDQAEIMDAFKSSKTKIYTLNKTYDLASENEFDEEFFEFGLFMSRREYKTIKRRLLRGKKQAQKEGYFIGSSLPYGFGKVRGDRGYVLAPNDETPVVQMIFHKFVYENMSLAEIRHYLDASGIKSKNGLLWNSATIRSMLRNKTYIGFIKYDYNYDRHRYMQGKHAPIVDLETFDRAQSKLDLTATRIKRNTTLKFPLASIVKCSVCGSTMQRSKHYIRCLTYQCPTVMSRVDRVEKQIISELMEELKDFNYFIENYGYEIEKRASNRLAEIELLENELEKKNKMLDKACEMLEMGVYSLEKYQKRAEILEEEKRVISERIEELQNVQDDGLKQIKKAVPILEKCLAEYYTLDVQGRNDLLKSIIEKVEYTKKNKFYEGADDMALKIFLKI